MDTPKKNQLRGVVRVQNYDTNLISHAVVGLSHSDVIKLTKQHYNYMQVKYTASRDGKLKAMDIIMKAMNDFINQSKTWVNKQDQKWFELEIDMFNITVISSQGMQLLKAIVNFDQIMTLLAHAQYAGNQSDDLRTNYFRAFNHLFMLLYKISQMTETNFHIDGSFRDRSIDISKYITKKEEKSKDVEESII